MTDKENALEDYYDALHQIPPPVMVQLMASLCTPQHAWRQLVAFTTRHSQTASMRP
jgi:hypothetical protein